MNKPVIDHTTKKIACIIIAVVAFWLGCVVSEFGQVPKDIEVKYDKFKDETEVFTFVTIKTTASTLNTGIGFYYSGQTLKTDQKAFELFFAGERCHGFCFENASLILLIDGERIKFPDERGLSDSAIFSADRETFAKIAAAKVVEFQVGDFEGKWAGPDIAKAKAVLDLGTKKP